MLAFNVVVIDVVRWNGRVAGAFERRRCELWLVLELWLCLCYKTMFRL